MKWTTLTILIVILIALVAWDRHLMEQTTETRRTSARIASLVSESVFEGRSIAAIRVEVGEEDIFLYVYHNGLWRCVQVHGAPAENRLIESILPAVLSAEGVVRTTDRADEHEFGLDRDNSIRIVFSGSEVFTDPAGDVIYAVDVGRSIASTGGSFVRPVGTDEIWEIDTDLRDVASINPEQMASGVPPMLDPHIIPQMWPGVRSGPQRVVIERQNESPIIITRREAEAHEEAAESSPRWEWVVGDGESQFLGELFQVTSYAVFLTRAPYAGVLSPREPAQVGLDQPRARITYETAEGAQLQLVFGDLGPRGGVVVFNTFTQVLYEVDRDIVNRLLPEIDLLLSMDQGNPWEQWMRR